MLPSAQFWVFSPPSAGLGFVAIPGSHGLDPNTIDSQDEVGGWDRYPDVHRPDDWDIDRDGIPSAWEKMHGLDPRDPTDHNEDTDGDGYTNLEEYMNSLVPDMFEVMGKHRK